MAWDGRIPYMDGKPMTYVSSWDEAQPDFEWRDNDEFEDRLTFVRFSRGRSAARGVFRSKHFGGKNVEMFLTDFADLVKSLKNGQVEGRFKFAKRGKNYGITLVEVR